MLNGIMLFFFFFMLNVVMLSVVALSVIMLNVVAPLSALDYKSRKALELFHLFIYLFISFDVF